MNCIPTRLKLSGHITVDKPLDTILSFLGHEWELYDGMRSSNDSCIDLFDILVANMMNARIDTAEKIRNIYNRRRTVEAVLAQLAPSASILDAAVDWATLTRLLDAFCRIPGAMEAVTTKILHRKRPALIPIMDSVLLGHYHKLFGYQVFPKYKRGRTPGTVLVTYMQRMRDEMQVCLPTLDVICEDASNKGLAITPLRAFEILLWVSCEPRGYYRGE